jgi:hypothetical protein
MVQRRSVFASIGLGIAFAAIAACAPAVPPATSGRLQIVTQLTWCGGAVPPPGEPSCHTAPTSTKVAVRRGRDVVLQVTTASDGVATVDVAPGSYVVEAVDAPGYMECDGPTAVVAAGTIASVEQTCTVYAP